MTPKPAVLTPMSETVHYSNNRRQAAFSNLFGNPQAFGTALLVAFLDEYGTEALAWTPATMFAEIEEDFRTPLSPLNKGKLIAAVGIVTTDRFFKSPFHFVQYCNALAGDGLSDIYDHADPWECGWGITEALLLNPPDDADENPFAEEILWYIGAQLSRFGIENPPDVLRIAKGYAKNKGYSEATTGDPMMFEAEYEMRKSETDSIETTIKDNIVELIEQLGELPLKNGDTKRLLQSLQKGLFSE